MSTYTPNKSIEQPAAGAYNNDWNVPVNADWAIIDTALGGVVKIVVTGVSAGTYAFTLSQYQPLIMEFGGVLSGNLTYVLPAGVGGIWSVSNSCSGSYNLSFGITGGNSFIMTAGNVTLVISDGTNVGYADTAYAAGVAAVAQAAAIAAAAVTSSNATNLTSGTVANARLPNAAVGPGVTIAANPGSAPTPTAPGQIWYYY
jgi:hypothetical protein